MLEILTQADWGGREEVVVSLSHALSALGHQVTVACPPDTPMCRRAQALGLPVWPIRLAGKRFGLRDLRALKQLLTEVGTDVTHWHDRATYAAVLHGSRAFRRQAMICTVHAVRSLNRRRRLVLRRLPRPLVAVSGAVHDSLVANGVPPEGVTVISNGVDVPSLCSRALPREQARQGLGLSPDGLVIGGVGRFSPEKGFRDFVLAARIIAHRDPGVQLVLVGDGPERPELERLAAESGLSDRLRFAGYRDDAARLLCALDVLLFPSVCDEACPMVPIQAGALGVPVVATRSGGAPEIVGDGRTGIVVEKGAPEQMADAALRLLCDEPLRRQMASAAAARVREQFDIATTARRYVELAELVLAAQRPARVPAEVEPCR
jgi:glycosyltransferase involved in cell wall biosynthesis